MALPAEVHPFQPSEISLKINRRGNIKIDYTGD